MMEEWLAFSETFSLTLLEGLTWPPGSQAAKEAFTEQWSLLRPAVLYFMKYKDGQHAPERILQAQKWLLDYGKSVEKVSSNVDPARYHGLMRMRVRYLHMSRVRQCWLPFQDRPSSRACRDRSTSS